MTETGRPGDNQAIRHHTISDQASSETWTLAGEHSSTRPDCKPSRAFLTNGTRHDVGAAMIMIFSGTKKCWQGPRHDSGTGLATAVSPDSPGYNLIHLSLALAGDIHSAPPN